MTKTSPIILLLFLSFYSQARETIVLTVNELNTAVGILISNDTISITDGTYNLTQTLVLNNKQTKISNVLIRSVSGDREKVKLFCPGMGVQSSSAPHVFNIYNVENVTIRDLTAGKTYWHPVTISGQSGAASVNLINLHLVDAGEQFIKVNNGETPKCNNGIADGCLIEYTDYAFWWDDRYYTQGFDKIGGGDGWTVRNCTFRNIRPHPDHVSDADGCGAAITFWQGGSQNVVEKNVIINCRKGIEFGISDNTGVTGGIIRNNIVYRGASEVGGDNGIMINDSPDIKVYNNTVILNATFDPQNDNIGKTMEYRWDGSTNLEMKNNLSDGLVWERTTGLNPTLEQNITNAALSWFKDAANADLHLVATATDAIDKGLTLPEVTDDIDGQSRPISTAYDIGADEYSQTAIKPNNYNKSIIGYNVYHSPSGITINYQLTKKSDVFVRIYDASGKKIQEISKHAVNPGVHFFRVPYRSFSRGVFYYILTCNNEMMVNKTLIYVK